MKKSPLYLLLQSFGASEGREARKFLLSPFFNTRTDLVRLFDYLIQTDQPEKEKAWKKAIQSSAPFDDQKCRLLMSYLHKLLEQYLIIKESQKEKLDNQLRLVRAYRHKGMESAMNKTGHALGKKLEQQPRRDAGYLMIEYDLQLERYWTVTSHDPTNALYLNRMEEALDAYYLSTRLRLICLSISQRGVYQTGRQTIIDRDIISFAEKKEWNDVPAVNIYLHCFRMLSEPDEPTHFPIFKKNLLALDGQFADEEMRGLYLMAINYCIRQFNQGADHYSREIFDLNKPGIESGYLLENGTLSRFTYINVAAAGLRIGELEWVEHFIHTHKNSLERRYRESSFSFNLARLEYTRRHFDLVLELLQKANYRDPLLNLAAKTLLLKTYYELAEYDLLQSHLDAMRNYVRRKRVIGYHQKNYLSIIRFTEKLMRVDVMKKENLLKLRKAIAEEEVLTEKEWLLECLG